MIAIEDIHGQFKTLKRLYKKVKKFNEPIIQLGDMIDRGKSSNNCVQFCIDNFDITLKGNHEHMAMSHIYQTGIYSKYTWIYNGGDACLDSYRRAYLAKDQDPPDNPIPENHLEFMKGLPLFYETDDVFFSHAGWGIDWDGIHDRKPLSKELVENENDFDNSLLWYRGDMANLGKLQVYGHTPCLKFIHEPVSNSVCIDGGAGYWKTMVAVRLDGGKVVGIFTQEVEE